VKLVAVGDVMIDVVCAETPPVGSRVHAEVSVRAGGSAVNAAMCAAAAGAQASVCGRIGADPAGNLISAALAAHGIEAHLARDQDLPTGAAVALRAGETASIVADRGANARLSPADVPDQLEADALLVSGFALFQSGSDEAARAAFQRFGGEWAGVDLASPTLAAGADLEVGANVVFATADEARAVTGAEPEEALRALASRFDVACVKLGDEGALAARGERVERCAAVATSGRSPFGAGDAFAATFLLALAGGDDLAGALQRACEAGARALSPDED
jgi:sugar/nucleoside kinase (ribokinase family)